MLVVTFAVPHESRIFRQTEASRSVRLLHTGIGQAAAAGALRRVFAGQLPHAVISSGFAGALDPQLRIGDLIADSSHSHPGVLSLLPSIIHCAPVHTAEHSVDSIAAKAELRRTTGASAVDMESSAVAAECIRAGVPLLILRAISDSATDPIPVPLPVAWNPETQRPRPLRLLAWLATHPARILPFARFLRGTNIAAHQLGQSLPDIVTTVAQGKFDRTAW